jgi:hypothetical protein
VPEDAAEDAAAGNEGLQLLALQVMSCFCNAAWLPGVFAIVTPVVAVQLQLFMPLCASAAWRQLVNIPCKQSALAAIAAAAAKPATYSGAMLLPCLATCPALCACRHMLFQLKMCATSRLLEALRVQRCSRKFTATAASSQQEHQAKQQQRQQRQLSSKP